MSVVLGFFHRNHTEEKVEDPYSPEQKEQINEIISELNEVLIKYGKEAVKHDL